MNQPLSLFPHTARADQAADIHGPAGQQLDSSIADTSNQAVAERRMRQLLAAGMSFLVVATSASARWPAVLAPMANRAHRQRGENRQRRMRGSVVVAAMLLAADVCAQGAFYKPKDVLVCPSGYRVSGQFCVPKDGRENASAQGPAFKPKDILVCPPGYYRSGQFCVPRDNEKNLPHIMNVPDDVLVCPPGYYRSAGYCVEKKKPKM